MIHCLKHTMKDYDYILYSRYIYICIIIQIPNTINRRRPLKTFRGCLPAVTMFTSLRQLRLLLLRELLRPQYAAGETWEGRGRRSRPRDLRCLAYVTLTYVLYCFISIILNIIKSCISCLHMLTFCFPFVLAFKGLEALGSERQGSNAPAATSAATGLAS